MAGRGICRVDRKHDQGGQQSPYERRSVSATVANYGPWEGVVQPVSGLLSTLAVARARFGRKWLAGLSAALLVALLSIALFGAPAGSASVASGSLSVRLSGLPSAQQPVAVLRGPGGLRRSVPARGLTIAKARVGLYRLTLGSVRITRASGAIKRGAIATALDSTVSVRVLAGRRAVLQGSYTAIINPGVKVLSGGALSVTGAADDPSTVVLEGRIALTRGAILSLPPSTLLPRGLLSNVVAIAYAAGKTTVSVTPASVYEVAPNYQFDVPLAASQASAAGVTASCGGPSGISPYVRATGISISGGWNTVSVLGVHIDDGVRVAVHFTAEAGVDVTGAVGYGCSLSVSFSANGMAGPIPVTATIEGELSASAGAGGVLTAGGSVHVDAGAHTIGLPPALLWSPDVSFSNPHFTFSAQTFAQATAGIGLTVKAGIGNSDLADVTLNVGTSVDFNAQPGSCTWAAKFGQFSAEGQLLDWSISTPQTPALFTQSLWQDPCGSTGSVGTGGGTGGTGGNGGGTGGTGGTGGGTGGTGGGTTSSAWTGPLAVPTSGAVSCASATFCVAADYSGHATIFNGTSWSTPTRVATASGDASANPVSCVSSSFCVLVDFGGDAYIYNGTSWSTAATVFNNPTGDSAVSCVSRTFCVAVDNGAAATYDGSSWSAPVNIDAADDLYGVSCSSVTLCVAVDDSKQALTYNGSSWSAPTTIVTSPTPSVSCAGASFCAVVGDTNVVTFDGQAWSGPTDIGSLAFPSVSCTSQSFCIIVDGAGRVFAYNGSSWSAPTQFAGGPAQFWVSCPTESFCAAVRQGASFFYRP
jgi:hypothetical protein